MLMLSFVELFAEVFCWLPLAHVISKNVFVIHGGLFSVDGVKLSDIRSIDHFCESPHLTKIMWFQTGNKGLFIHFNLFDCLCTISLKATSEWMIVGSVVTSCPLYILEVTVI